MGDIRLHPTLGVNPRITMCPMCCRDSGLVLLGIHNYYDTCSDCDSVVYGGINNRSPCPKCGSKHRKDRTYLDEHQQHVPVPVICSECQGYMKDNIALILAEKTEAGMKRLGIMAWIREEAWKRLMRGPEVEQSLKMRSAYVDKETWDKLGLPYEATKEPETTEGKDDDEQH